MAGRRVGWFMAMAVGVALVATACFVPFDFTGDSHADPVAIDRNGVWWNGDTQLFVGQPTDWPVAGDYDGNGTSEVAVARGDQWITQGAAGTITYPPPAPIDVPHTSGYAPGILPVSADYNGDGKTDPAWYREADATWWISTTAGPVTFGTPYHDGRPDYDIPVPADYNGDGKADIATFSPTTATWHVKDGPDVQVGGLGDIPAPADYDGVKGAEPATLDVFHNTFHIAAQPDAVLPVPDTDSQQGVVPAPADYNGVGHAQPAVDTPLTGHWYITDQPMITTHVAFTPAAAGVSSSWRPAGSSTPSILLRMTALKECQRFAAIYCYW